MDNNYGYLDQEVEQFAAYVDTLKEARKSDKMGIGCGTALMLVIVGFVALCCPRFSHLHISVRENWNISDYWHKIFFFDVVFS